MCLSLIHMNEAGIYLYESYFPASRNCWREIGLCDRTPQAAAHSTRPRPLFFAL